jgi:hypothetical protein
MLSPIDLDDEHPPQTGEIDDVGTNGHLTAKMHSKEMAAEISPEATLRVGHGLTQLACTSCRVHQGGPLLTSPLSGGGT